MKMIGAESETTCGVVSLRSSGAMTAATDGGASGLMSAKMSGAVILGRNDAMIAAMIVVANSLTTAASMSVAVVANDPMSDAPMALTESAVGSDTMSAEMSDVVSLAMTGASGLMRDVASLGWSGATVATETAVAPTPVQGSPR